MNTQLNEDHRDEPRADALAADIMLAAHPREGLVAFLGLGQKELLTAAIMHTAHTQPGARISDITERIRRRTLAGFDADVRSSNHGGARALWASTLDRHDVRTAGTLVLNLGAQLESLAQRAAA